MSLFNSISRGFGMSLGNQAAKKVTSSGIDGTFKVAVRFIKWSLIITFVIGMIQGFME